MITMLVVVVGEVQLTRTRSPILFSVHHPSRLRKMVDDNVHVVVPRSSHNGVVSTIHAVAAKPVHCNINQRETEKPIGNEDIFF